MHSQEGHKGVRIAIRALVFLGIAAVAVFVCSHILGFADSDRSNTTLEQFYQQDRDTVDCVYLGSSVSQRGFVVPAAFHDHGVASYSLTCGTQPFVLTKYLMKEVMKTQDPKLFIIELKGTCKGPDDIAEVALRRMVDNMKPSVNRYQAIHSAVSYASEGKNQVDKSGLSYYIPLVKYHTRWNPAMQPKEIGLDYYKGYVIDPEVTFKVRTIHPLEYTEDTYPIAKETEAVLNDLLDFCDTIDADVLFVISPYQASETGMGKLNYSRNIVEKRGYRCLNFLPASKREELGLEDMTSYYNQEHLNYAGSLLFTDYLCEYIQDQYGIADHRGDGAYGSWEAEYSRLEKNLDGVYAEKVAKMKEKIKERRSGAE